MTDDTDDTDDTTTVESTENESSGRDSTTGTDAADRPSDARADDASAGEADGGRSRDMVRYVNYLVLVALVVLALVSGIQFYGAVSRTINQWVTAEYRSLFHGAFNLAVLLIAAAGISLQVRRVTS